MPHYVANISLNNDKVILLNSVISLFSKPTSAKAVHFDSNMVTKGLNNFEEIHSEKVVTVDSSS